MRLPCWLAGSRGRTPGSWLALLLQPSLRWGLLRRLQPETLLWLRLCLRLARRCCQGRLPGRRRLGRLWPWGCLPALRLRLGFQLWLQCRGPGVGLPGALLAFGRMMVR